MLVYLSPVHVNVHQESCLWLVEFIHGLVKTVNIQLALTVKDEGKSFLVSRALWCVVVSYLCCVVLGREDGSDSEGRAGTWIRHEAENTVH